MKSKTNLAILPHTCACTCEGSCLLTHWSFGFCEMKIFSSLLTDREEESGPVSPPIGGELPWLLVESCQSLSGCSQLFTELGLL